MCARHSSQAEHATGTETKSPALGSLYLAGDGVWGDSQSAISKISKCHSVLEGDECWGKIKGREKPAFSGMLGEDCNSKTGWPRLASPRRGHLSKDLRMAFSTVVV